MTKRKNTPRKGKKQLRRRPIRALYRVESETEEYFYTRKDWAEAAKKAMKKQGQKGVHIVKEPKRKKLCAVCGKSVKRIGAQFCSRKCYNEARRFEAKRRI